MRLGNNNKGKVNGHVSLTEEDIELLLECIWHFTNLIEDSKCAYQYPRDKKSALTLERQLQFMKKEMRNEHSEKA